MSRSLEDVPTSKVIQNSKGNKIDIFHSVETWSHSFVHGPYRALASLVALGVLSPPNVIEPGLVGAQIEAQC
eukprot:scaffold14648_cov101-Isochrysis_galbana.AAC.3